MTSSMRHWKQSLDAESRRALEAGASDAPPEGEQERVWASLATAVSVTGGLFVAGTAAKGPTASTLATGALTKSAIANGVIANGVIANGTTGSAQALGHGLALVALKAVAIGFTVGTLANVGLAVVERVQSPPHAAPAARAPYSSATTPRRLPMRPLASAPDRPERDGDSAAQGDALSPSSSQERLGSPREALVDAQSRVPSQALVGADDALLAESALLLRSRQALGAAEPARALDLTYEHRRRFASGKLAQERDAIEIEALAQLGQVTLARSRAEAFLRTYPVSPHRAKVLAVNNELSKR